jgi:GMP synthase (glutamine-hydrolysing)
MRALILEHAEHESGGLVVAGLARAGVGCDVARSWRGEAAPDDAGYALLVVLGGAMSAWEDAAHPWLAREAALLAARARADRPTLAICLGAQLLARGLGAANWRGPTNELGLLPIALSAAGRADPLLAPLDGQPVLHWHQDSFALPAGAVLLASSNAYAHQAFRIGAHVYGVQFHIECDRAMRRDWARRGADELRAAGVDPATLAGDAADLADLIDPIDRRGRDFARALLNIL